MSGKYWRLIQHAIYMYLYRVLTLLWSILLPLYRSAFGKLGELSKKLESMQLLYLWQQQEPSYEMLRDFSGRPDESANEEGEQDILGFEPEM